MHSTLIQRRMGSLFLKRGHEIEKCGAGVAKKKIARRSFSLLVSGIPNLTLLFLHSVRYTVLLYILLG